jgi:biotin-dependent carboxylase-like uncharacterized protein
MTVLSVASPGLHTSVQDLGRFGHARSGVPVAGALDPAALTAANLAVGNPGGAAGLECVLRGPALVGDAEWSVAVVGAGWALGPEPVAPGVPYTVRLPAGLRCWVGLGGGLDTPLVLGSRSTDTLSGLGGRVLQAGDRLELGAERGPYQAVVAGPALPEGEVVLRVMAGPHADRLSGRLDGVAFTVSSHSDRTAVRLDGPPVARSAGDIATLAVLPGAVQLPADGQPIVLLGNCQTTGGYPVVAVVCAADLRLAAQLRPGAVVRLEWVSVGVARELLAQAAD